MIPYSYKAFKSSELNFDGQISHSEIKRLDYIDLRQMKDEELPDTQNLKNAYDNAVNHLGKLMDITTPFTKREK